MSITSGSGGPFVAPPGNPPPAQGQATNFNPYGAGFGTNRTPNPASDTLVVATVSTGPQSAATGTIILAVKPPGGAGITVSTASVNNANASGVTSVGTLVAIVPAGWSYNIQQSVGSGGSIISSIEYPI